MAELWNIRLGSQCSRHEMKPAESKQFVFRPFEVTRVLYRSPPGETPRPRSGHRIVCDGERLYCFGGYNPTANGGGAERPDDTWSLQRPLFKELWSYSVARRRWQLLRPPDNLPDELASNAMCTSTDGSKIMIFGGTGSPFGRRCSRALLAYSTRRGGDLLELRTRGARPPGQYGQATLCLPDHFYSVGGTDGFDYTCDVYRLDLNTLTWESLYVGHGSEDEPIGRYRHELACDGRDIYVLAGGTGEWAFDLVDVPVFNIETKSWSTATAKMDTSHNPPLAPLPRKCHSAVQIQTDDGIQVFVMGGSDGVSVFNDVWRLELRSMQWTLMRETVLPKLLYFHSSTATPEGCAYTFGGIEPGDESGRRNNELYKVWLRIPKLSEICWEALLFYNPHLDAVDGERLLDSGVPRRFVERLK